MKRFIATAAFAVASLTNPIDAFHAPTGPRRRRPPSRLRSTFDKDAIKKAGAGITTQVPGDLCFYDPNEKGKLAGSNTLADRVERGASFAFSDDAREEEEETPPPPVVASLAAPEPPVFEPEPAPSAPEPPVPEPEPEPPAPEQPKSLTTNLRNLLNGQFDVGKGWGRSSRIS